MEKKMKKMVLLMALVMAMMIVGLANTASAADDERGTNTDDDVCTEQQVEGGWEVSYDGSECVFTNWNSSQGCLGGYDVDVGELGEGGCEPPTTCADVECDSDGSGGGVDGDGPECRSIGECFTDEEGGSFSPDSYDAFADNCERFDGDFVDVWFEAAEGFDLHMICTFEKEREQFGCWQHLNDDGTSDPIWCVDLGGDYTGEYHPGAEPVVVLTAENDELSSADGPPAPRTNAGSASGGRPDVVAKQVQSTSVGRAHSSLTAGAFVGR